jgi:thiol-disulfide isomerase/thioredoxin
VFIRLFVIAFFPTLHLSTSRKFLPEARFFQTAVTMAMLCICGVCIPYSALLPLIAFLFRFMAKPFSKIMELIENVLPWTTDPKTESHATQVATIGTSTSQNTNVTSSSTTCCRQDMAEEIINNSGRINEVVTCIKSMEQWEEHNANYETVICKFTASWCKPCKKIEPSFQLLAEEYHRSRTDRKNISFVKVTMFVSIVGTCS